jgi:hypothetical protein
MVEFPSRTSAEIEQKAIVKNVNSPACRFAHVQLLEREDRHQVREMATTFQMWIQINLVSISRDVANGTITLRTLVFN